MSKSNIVPLNQNETPNPNRLSFTLEEMLAEFENGAVPRSKYWKELITALYDTANHVVTGVTSVAKVKPDNVGNIPLLPKDCLLYTSPSPRDRQKSRMPSSA